MRRRSERRRSTDISSPATTTRRSSRRSKKSPSRSPESKRGKHDETEGENEEVYGKSHRDNDSDREEQLKPTRGRRRKSITPGKEQISPTKKGKRDIIKETITEEENGDETDRKQKTDVQVEVDKPEIQDNITPVDKSLEKPESEIDIKNDEKSVDLEQVEAKSNVKTIDHEETASEIQEVHGSEEKVTQILEVSNLEYISESRESEDNQKLIDVENQQAASSLQDTKKDDGIADSSDVIKRSHTLSKCKRNSSESRRRSSSVEKSRQIKYDEKSSSAFNLDEKENKKDEKDTVITKSSNNAEVGKNDSKVAEKSKSIKKRKWLSRKSSESKPHVLAISTDSLKNLISDVHPVPLSDVNLDSSPEIQVVQELEINDDELIPTEIIKAKDRSRKRERESKRSDDITITRKVSIASDEDGSHLQVPPSPPRNECSNILYITNLVRPFTVLQLKGLLARTGKIVENGFWIDRIKSKCYVRYENEDEATETRHALHGVRWPTSNPKCLNVDFGTESEMGKAIASTTDESLKVGADSARDNRIVGTGWDRDRFDFDEKKDVQVSRPVREWDMGKKEEFEKESERIRDKERNRDREGRDRDRDRDRDGDRRRDERKGRSNERDNKRSTSVSPVRKFKKKENDPPLRLLDDLFRKTKTTPCIYWLPLTPEQITEKEEARRKRIQEHEELRKEREREREKEREREREREKEKERLRRERDRSGDRRRSRSRDRRRY